MGTSRSIEHSATYIGGASIYSGRPDPSWVVDDETAARLKASWSLMEPYTGPLPQAPVLGYRGCSLSDSSRNKWIAYGGVATLTTPAGSESRRDKNRQFESLLVSSAPEGTIPLELIDFKK